MTTVKKEMGETTLVGCCDSQYEELLQQLFQGLEEKPYGEGDLISFGFLVCTLEKREGDYHLLSPDFSKNPLEDNTEDLSFGLKIHQNQKNLEKKLKITGDPIAYHQGIVVMEGVFAEERIFLERDLPEAEGDSGWLITADDAEVEELSKEDVSLLQAYQLVQQCPDLLTALSLPVGYAALLLRGKVVAVFNEKNENLLRK